MPEIVWESEMERLVPRKNSDYLLSQPPLFLEQELNKCKIGFRKNGDASWPLTTSNS